MTKDRSKGGIKNLTTLFQIFEKVNFISMFHSRIKDSFLLEVLYAIVPVVMYSINIINMIKADVLYGKSDEFTYINDLGNSLGLTSLFFLSYFLSGYFPQKFEEFLESGVNKSNMGRTSSLLKKVSESKICLWVIRLILLGVGILSGYVFYHTVEVQGAYWIKGLSESERVFYCLILGFTWYQSIILLFMASLAGLVIYRCIKTERIIYAEKNYNRNMSVIKAFDILICTFSYGLFYIIGSILIILNDKIADNYGMDNIFDSDLKAFILVLVIFCIIVLEFIPLKELLKYMKRKKDERIIHLNKQIEYATEDDEKIINERDKLIAQNLVVASLGNKIAVVLSIGIPLTGVIIQGIELLVK